MSCTRVSGTEIISELTEDQRAQDYYQIEVRDNGIGFIQEEADRIFNVFTRRHGNAEYNGTGVGLSIVRKVVENHRALVSASAEMEKGATFRIWFPVTEITSLSPAAL